VIEYFVDVAKECINIGNFNSLMAIIGKLVEKACYDDYHVFLLSVICVCYTRHFLDFNNFMFPVAGARIWNNLPLTLPPHRCCLRVRVHHLKMHLFHISYPDLTF